ncbi:MAG: hypothetical protein J2O44_01895 [Porphyrobacter sp.]|nr:hypothetical protein [Porphyrobacter sp.]
MLAIVGAPAMAIWATVRKQRHQKEMLQIQLQADATAEKAAQYVANHKDLEDRVRVLERIVTDKGYDVAAQIEALRDARRVEAQLEAPQPKERV